MITFTEIHSVEVAYRQHTQNLSLQKHGRWGKQLCEKNTNQRLEQL